MAALGTDLIPPPPKEGGEREYRHAAIAHAVLSVGAQPPCTRRRNQHTAHAHSQLSPFPQCCRQGYHPLWCRPPPYAPSECVCVCVCVCWSEGGRLRPSRTGHFSSCVCVRVCVCVSAWGAAAGNANLCVSARDGRGRCGGRRPGTQTSACLRVTVGSSDARQTLELHRVITGPAQQLFSRGRSREKKQGRLRGCALLSLVVRSVKYRAVPTR